jgi:hypothetical protein
MCDEDERPVSGATQNSLIVQAAQQSLANGEEPASRCLLKRLDKDSSVIAIGHDSSFLEPRGVGKEISKPESTTMLMSPCRETVSTESVNGNDTASTVRLLAPADSPDFGYTDSTSISEGGIFGSRSVCNPKVSS